MAAVGSVTDLARSHGFFVIRVEGRPPARHFSLGRTPGAPNKATVEVRALASSYGADAIAALAKLAGIGKDEAGNPDVGAESDQARISALGHLLDRGYGKSPLSVPIRLDLPAADTPAGVIVAMARIISAVAGGEISPADGRDLAGLIELQRKAIELGDHEERLRAIEARAGIGGAHASH
jgi:hypothetical protein